jgi:hypothetical protein
VLDIIYLTLSHIKLLYFISYYTIVLYNIFHYIGIFYLFFLKVGFIFFFFFFKVGMIDAICKNMVHTLQEAICMPFICKTYD